MFELEVNAELASKSPRTVLATLMLERLAGFEDDAEVESS
jgi:hypothetical protein